MIRTTKPRGRPKRRHSEGVGNHTSKKPRTASVEVTLPVDATASYNLPSTSSSIMSEVVNVILAQVASQQRQQQQQQSQVLTDELQDNVEVVTAPPPSNELIIIENSLDSTNTVEVWAGGEGGGANITGEVNQILQRIGVGQSEEAIQDSVEGDVVVTEATAEEFVSQEIIMEETSCEEPLATSTTTAVDTGQEEVTISNESPSNSDIVEQQIPVCNETDEVNKSTPAHDNVTTTPPTNNVILPHSDDITTVNNDTTAVNDNV